MSKHVKHPDGRRKRQNYLHNGLDDFLGVTFNEVCQLIQHFQRAQFIKTLKKHSDVAVQQAEYHKLGDVAILLH